MICVSIILLNRLILSNAWASGLSQQPFFLLRKERLLGIQRKARRIALRLMHQLQTTVQTRSKLRLVSRLREMTSPLQGGGSRFNTNVKILPGPLTIFKPKNKKYDSYRRNKANNIWRKNYPAFNQIAIRSPQHKINY